MITERKLDIYSGAQRIGTAIEIEQGQFSATTKRPLKPDELLTLYDKDGNLVAMVQGASFCN